MHDSNIYLSLSNTLISPISPTTTSYFTLSLVLFDEPFHTQLLIPESRTKISNAALAFSQILLYRLLYSNFNHTAYLYTLLCTFTHRYELLYSTEQDCALLHTSTHRYTPLGLTTHKYASAAVAEGLRHHFIVMSCHREYSKRTFIHILKNGKHIRVTSVLVKVSATYR